MRSMAFDTTEIERKAVAALCSGGHDRTRAKRAVEALDLRMSNGRDLRRVGNELVCDLHTTYNIDAALAALEA